MIHTLVDVSPALVCMDCVMMLVPFCGFRIICNCWSTQLIYFILLYFYLFIHSSIVLCVWCKWQDGACVLILRSECIKRGREGGDGGGGGWVRCNGGCGVWLWLWWHTVRVGWADRSSEVFMCVQEWGGGVCLGVDCGDGRWGNLLPGLTAITLLASVRLLVTKHDKENNKPFLSRLKLHSPVISYMITTIIIILCRFSSVSNEANFVRMWYINLWLLLTLHTYVHGGQRGAARHAGRNSAARPELASVPDVWVNGSGYRTKPVKARDCLPRKVSSVCRHCASAARRLIARVGVDALRDAFQDLRHDMAPEMGCRHSFRVFNEYCYHWTNLSLGNVYLIRRW